MGLRNTQKELRRNAPDPVTRLVTAVLYFGMLAAIAASLWAGIRSLPAL